MTAFTELRLADGTAIRFQCFPGPAAAPHEGGSPYTHDSPHEGGSPYDDPHDMPDGMGRSVPVARGGERVAAFAVESLRQTLRPLAPLLQEVHDAVLAAPDPPQEVSVSFGLQVGQDLKLGVVGAQGQAHLTVSATWQPTSGPSAG